MSRFATLLSIPESTQVEARRICSVAVGERVVRRTPLPIVAASSLLVACRESLAPVTLRELAASSGLSEKEM
jgi:transcription initiation factor TFIIIB Brf1 subunit/transcription initiation factor TFIIB